MGNLNRVLIIGRVGKVACKQVGGKTVANFSVAVNETWKDKGGEKQERTEWFSCNAWEELAEIIEKYVSVGREVFVEGSLRTRSYEKDGATKYVTELRANTVQMLGPRPGSDADSAPEPF